MGGQGHVHHRRPPTGPHADLIRFWEETWSATRGERWVWLPKDAVQIARALRMACNNQEDAERRIRVLLHSGDAWLAQNASPALLVSRWNQLGYEVVRRPQTTVQRGYDHLGRQSARPGVSIGPDGLPVFEDEAPRRLSK
jgi:hypothetical protein